MSATPTIHRTSAVLKMPARKALVSAFATSVVNAMTSNASFPKGRGGVGGSEEPPPNYFPASILQ
jgi:hypothetical protein